MGNQPLTPQQQQQDVASSNISKSHPVNSSKHFEEHSPTPLPSTPNPSSTTTTSTTSSTNTNSTFSTTTTTTNNLFQVPENSIFCRVVVFQESQLKGNSILYDSIKDPQTMYRRKNPLTQPKPSTPIPPSTQQQQQQQQTKFPPKSKLKVSFDTDESFEQQKQPKPTAAQNLPFITMDLLGEMIFGAIPIQLKTLENTKIHSLPSMKQLIFTKLFQVGLPSQFIDPLLREQALLLIRNEEDSEEEEVKKRKSKWNGVADSATQLFEQAKGSEEINCRSPAVTIQSKLPSATLHANHPSNSNSNTSSSRPRSLSLQSPLSMLHEQQQQQSIQKQPSFSEIISSSIVDDNYFSFKKKSGMEVGTPTKRRSFPNHIETHTPLPFDTPDSSIASNALTTPLRKNNTTYMCRSSFAVGLVILFQGEEKIQHELQRIILSHFSVIDVRFKQLLKICVEGVRTILKSSMQKAHEQETLSKLFNGYIFNIKLLNFALQTDLEIRKASRDFLRFLHGFVYAPRLEKSLWYRSTILPQEKSTLFSIFLKGVALLSDRRYSAEVPLDRFLGSVFTAILSNHLSWICKFTKTKQEEESISNLSLRQLRSIYGAGYWKETNTNQSQDYFSRGPKKWKRFCKVVVVGSNAQLIREFLHVFSYLLRCDEILEKDFSFAFSAKSNSVKSTATQFKKKNQIVVEAISREGVNKNPLLFTRYRIRNGATEDKSMSLVSDAMSPPLQLHSSVSDILNEIAAAEELATTPKESKIAQALQQPSSETPNQFFEIGPIIQHGNSLWNKPKHLQQHNRSVTTMSTSSTPTVHSVSTPRLKSRALSGSKVDKLLFDDEEREEKVKLPVLEFGSKADLIDEIVKEEEEEEVESEEESAFESMRQVNMSKFLAFQDQSKLNQHLLSSLQHRFGFPLYGDVSSRYCGAFVLIGMLKSVDFLDEAISDLKMSTQETLDGDDQPPHISTCIIADIDDLICNVFLCNSKTATPKVEEAKFSEFVLETIYQLRDLKNMGMPEDACEMYFNDRLKELVLKAQSAIQLVETITTKQRLQMEERILDSPYLSKQPQQMKKGATITFRELADYLHVSPSDIPLLLNIASTERADLLKRVKETQHNSTMTSNMNGNMFPTTGSTFSFGKKSMATQSMASSYVSGLFSRFKMMGQQ